jgi:MFS family permease
MLSHRGFRRLWTAGTIDAFGSWLLVLALPLHVYQVSRSMTATALTFAVEAAPALLIGPWAGVLVDRWPRRRVLVLGNLVAAAGVALIPATVYGGLLVENVAVCFVQPALAAALPSVVGTGPELVAANAWTSAGNSVLRMLGPLAGTFLVARGDFAVVVLVDALSYLVAAGLLARLALPSPAPGPDASGLGAYGSGVSGRDASGPAEGGPGDSRRRVTAELRAGLAAVVRTRMLSGLIVTTWLFWAANAALTILLVARAGAGVGRLIAGLGLGYLAGSALAKTTILRYGTRTVLTSCYLAVGACFVVAFASPALWVIALAGVPGAVIGVAVRHRIQASTPPELLGRVSTAFFASDALAAVCGAMAAPVLGPVTLSAVVLSVGVLAFVLLPGGAFAAPEAPALG